ncbi:transcriptional regulator, Crp/Fnr family [Arcticibacter svalbardensis MN12-7]|uniref:Transcriptional regulator, Crp/Fnr family n=1 Tax=Arcticibacter svalbardensis MN12-7 TaxID=1150600 RepID=R9GT06_9SPHI|nr:Crp/Fnr family transcriptional regulator [Arcticibacter svalbardensis]EOR94997.1 transcriptional regulator, Crp/Fnr family [Arcticibacter svalbardensis MN12-7]
MKLSKNNYGTENCYLSNSCLKEWLPAIEVNKKIYEVKKGEVIFEEGDLVEGMYFVYEGNIKVHKKWGDKELILRIASDESILGHRGLSTTNNKYPISATALEDAVICYISMDFFNSTLKVNPGFSYKILMFFADELQESERKMRNIAHMSVKGRLSRSLLFFKDQFGVHEDGTLKIKLSKQDISSYIGATYETLFRIMNELIEDKAISVTKRAIVILNPDKLLEFSKKEE